MTVSGYRYRAKDVDRRYMDWHYELDRRCSQMDLDSVEIDCRTGEWLALIETTTNPEKSTRWLRWGASKLGIPGYLLLLPAVEPLIPETRVTVSIVHWPTSRGAIPWRTKTGSLAHWGEYIEQRIHRLPGGG